jgi:hypothetical protein
MQDICSTSLHVGSGTGFDIWSIWSCLCSVKQIKSAFYSIPKVVQSFMCSLSTQVHYSHHDSVLIFFLYSWRTICLRFHRYLRKRRLWSIQSQRRKRLQALVRYVLLMCTDSEP